MIIDIYYKTSFGSEKDSGGDEREYSFITSNIILKPLVLY